MSIKRQEAHVNTNKQFGPKSSFPKRLSQPHNKLVLMSSLKKNIFIQVRNLKMDYSAFSWETQEEISQSCLYF